MGWSPRLNTICAACGRKRELLGHICVNPRRKGRGVRLKVSFGKCPKCKRPYGGNPAAHVCAPRSDFKKRKKEFEAEQAKRAREAARKARPKHDYTECSAAECKRSLCVAYKAGRELGDLEGYARGWDHAYDRGFADGQAACPLDHKLGEFTVHDILIVLAVLAVWAVSLLVRPTKACGSCARRPWRRRGPCGRCKGTGRVFRVGARLVHRGAVKGHQEGRRRWGR